RSSVFGLKASPQTPNFLPRRLPAPKCAFAFCASSRFWRSLTASTADSSVKSRPWLRAVAISAFTSLGKQLPPYPQPGKRNFCPMRSSAPIALRTESTSAPTRSQSMATSFMKEIRVALGSADGDEHHVARAHRVGEGRREADPLGGDVLVQQLFQAGLVKRGLALAQRRDLLLVDVDAHDRVPRVREADPRHQPDVAGPYDDDAHLELVPRRPRRGRARFLQTSSLTPLQGRYSTVTDLARLRG